jgi:cytosine/adenosine deaminase-related metal-dependent hydrolase
MILRAPIVVTMHEAPLENGAVAISANRVADVGTFAEVKAHHTGKIIDLDGQVLLPGLINAHAHLDYTCLRGKIPPPESFADWIRAINAEKAKLSADDYVASINAGFAEAKRFGTTTIANLTAFAELIARIAAPIRTWWFAELIDIRNPGQPKNVVDAAVESLRSATHWGLAPHAPFTASAGLYRHCEEVARAANVLVTTHLAESEEEMQMAFDLGGALCAFLNSIGAELFESHGQTPVQTMLQNVCQFDERWLLVHLNSVLDNDLDLLGQLQSKPHVIHCPRSHAYFGHAPFQFARLRELGFNICLGTDSLASTDDLNLFAEMRQFQRNTAPGLSARELLELVTINPAHALGQDKFLGRISRGFHADFITIPRQGDDDVFEQILAFDQVDSGLRRSHFRFLFLKSEIFSALLIWPRSSSSTTSRPWWR